MGEQIAKTASNLLPLLGILFGIFALLMIALILLRIKVRRDAGFPLLSRRRKALSPADMRCGDVVTVLGRTFNVTALSSLDDESSWCGLDGENTSARLRVKKDLSEALYFPGRGEPSGAAVFPQEIKREDGEYRRAGEPVPVEDDYKICLYRGPGEHWLAVEARGENVLLWRGKAIPPEGITILEEK